MGSIATLCLLAALAAGPAAGPDREGIWTVILSAGDTLTECRLRDVNDSLLTVDRLSGSLPVPVGSVAMLIRQRDAHVWAGAGIGLLAGMGIGALVGSAITRPATGASLDFSGLVRAIAVGIGAGGGAVAGGIAGALTGIDEHHPLADSTGAARVRTIRRLMAEGSDAQAEALRTEELERRARERKVAVQRQRAADRMIRTDPEPLLMAQAEYPEMARTAGVTGTVYVRVIVDSDGTPRSATVLKGIGAGCDEAATDAALRSTFKPGTSYGKPVECSITIPFTFP